MDLLKESLNGGIELVRLFNVLHDCGEKTLFVGFLDKGSLKDERLDKAKKRRLRGKISRSQCIGIRLLCRTEFH